MLGFQLKELHVMWRIQNESREQMSRIVIPMPSVFEMQHDW